MYLHKLNKEDSAALVAWWHWLDDNRSDRAVLRRAKSPDDVLLTSAFAHFLQKLPERWGENKDIPLTGSAMVAAILARVKAEPDKQTSFAKALAQPKERGSKAVMSELRFQQLQKSRTPEDFFIRLCRAVDLLNRKANIVSLADDILYWLAEYRFGPSSKPSERLAIRWASDYYRTLKD